MTDRLRPIRNPPADGPEAIKQRAYIAARRAWNRRIGIPWPRTPEDDRPPPGTIDIPPIDEG